MLPCNDHSEFDFKWNCRSVHSLVVTPLIAKDFLPGFHSDFVRRISESVEMQRNALQLPIRTTFWALLGFTFGSEAMQGVFNLNLRLRLVIHLIAIVILPTAILARIISFL